MHINRSTIKLAVVALSASLLLNACHTDKKADNTEEQQQSSVDQPTVEVADVKKGELSSTIAVPGELLPDQEVNLYAKVNSYVKKLLVDLGSEVSRGQLLGVLDAPEINSQLAGAQSRVKQMEAVYYASKANYNRLLSTSKTPGTISLNDLEQSEAKMNADLANVEAAKSSYREVSSNVGYLEVRAPFDGIITSRNVNLGAYVGPGGKSTEPLFVLQNQRKLRLVVSVPENYAGALRKGNEVKFTIRELPGEKFSAKISRVAGAIDDKLRSERVEMDVQNPKKKLLPHMYADVNVPLPSRDSTFIVPKTAVVTSTEKVFVIKVVNHRAQWVDVQKGFQSGDDMEVYGELKPGDKVIKNATDEIRDGQTVKDK